MNKPLTLSIIIPVYNESDYLKACLDAISTQTVKPDEVIVVDNNSTDDSVKIAKKYEFVKVVSEKKQGIVYARNAGFNSSKSDILTRIDSDSTIPPDWVAEILKFYSESEHYKNDFAWVSSGYWYNVDHPKIYSWIFSQIVFRFNGLILGHYPLWGSSMAITRNSWSKVKNQVRLRNDIHEDLDLSIHLYHNGTKISYKTDIKVGVYLRRVYTDFDQLWSYSLLWPRTLRVNHLRGWVLGLIGAVLTYLIAPILILESKINSLLTGKKYQ